MKSLLRQTLNGIALIGILSCCQSSVNVEEKLTPLKLDYQRETESDQQCPSNTKYDPANLSDPLLSIFTRQLFTLE